MKIIPLIQELLLSHDCVVVPGFGGFLANYSPARVDKGSSTIHPPRKVLSFNKNLTHNDGLLIGALSVKLNVGYNESRTIVEEQVLSFKRRINAGQTIIFDGIGSFMGNGEGNLLFEPDMSVNYLPSSFGLEPFRFDPLEKYDVREKVIRPVGKEPIRSYSTRKILWRAAVIIPIIALMVAVPFRKEIFKLSIQETTLNPLAKTELENNIESLDNMTVPVAEKIAGDNMDIGNSSITTEETTVSMPSEEIVSEPYISLDYNVITGSFKVRQNALAQVAILKESGFEAEIIEAANGFYRVCAGSFSDIETATDRKNILLDSNFSGSWINKSR